MSKGSGTGRGSEPEARGAAEGRDTETWKEGRVDLGGHRHHPFRPEPCFPEERECDGVPRGGRLLPLGGQLGGPSWPLVCGGTAQIEHTDPPRMEIMGPTQDCRLPRCRDDRKQGGRGLDGAWGTRVPDLPQEPSQSPTPQGSPSPQTPISPQCLPSPPKTPHRPPSPSGPAPHPVWPLSRSADHCCPHWEVGWCCWDCQPLKRRLKSDIFV